MFVPLSSQSPTTVVFCKTASGALMSNQVKRLTSAQMLKDLRLFIFPTSKLKNHHFTKEEANDRR